MKKGLLSILLACVLMLGSLAPVNAFAAETHDVVSAENVWFNPLYEELRTEEEKAELIASLAEKAASRQNQSRASVLNRAGEVYDTVEAAADYIREQMVARNTEITFSIKSSVIPSNVWDLLYTAMEYSEDCTGQEGDALLACLDYASVSYNTMQGVSVMTLNVGYYTTAAQEEELTMIVDVTLDWLNLEGKSDYQKVRLIHDYICDNVDYDTYHLEQEQVNGIEYPLMYTAYAAISDGKAVCQGYAALFYRMCKDAGLSVRFVTGDAGGRHAWNIVKIGDVYYNIDTTWDGQDVDTHYGYFLKSQADFVNHVRDSEPYDTAAFHTQFPMASDSWEDYSQISETSGLNKQNLSESTYYNIDGSTITNYANGKPKVLVFGSIDCGNTIGTISSLSKEDLEGLDVVFIDATSMPSEPVIEFRDTYGSVNDDIVYAYNTDGTNMWEYIFALSNTNSITYPYIVYIDADNLVQFAEYGRVFSGNSIKNKANVYCGTGELIKLSKYSLRLEINESQDLEVLVYNNNCNSQFFTWTSSNTRVATVDENGMVKGTGKGSAVITCKANDDVYATCQVNVASDINGMNKDADGVWRYYKNGEVDTTHTALEKCTEGWIYVKNGEFDGTYTGIARNSAGWWYVTNGILDRTFTGMTKYGASWLYINKGKWDTTYTGLVKTNGEFWYIKNGKFDTTYTGLFENTAGFWYIKNGKLDTTANGMTRAGTEWVYLKNGKIDTDYTGMAQNSAGWWYITNGRLDLTFTGLGKNSEGFWYMKNGKVDTTYTGWFENSAGLWYIKAGKLDTTANGMMKVGSQWVYLKNGKLDTSYTGMAQNSAGWWYIKEGKLDLTYTGMAKGSEGWCYVTNGKLDTSYTGMAKNSAGWWYIKDGMLDLTYTGMAQNSNGWWYMKNGKLDTTANGFTRAGSEWVYLKNGKLDTSYTGLVENSAGWWYIKAGRLDTTANGLMKVGSEWVYLKNGKLDTTYTGLIENSAGWWYIKAGKLDTTANGFMKAGSEWVYLKNGKLDTTYTGMAKNTAGWWYVNAGRLDLTYTGMAKNEYGWWYMKNGKLDLTYTGLARNTAGWWYMKNGKLDTTYNGTCVFNGRTYTIVNGKVV